MLSNLYYLGRSYLNMGLSYLIFFVTAKCDARCKMCFYWKEMDHIAHRRSLDLDEIDKISRSIKHLASLSISGGEPTLRSDLHEIVHLFYKNSGTRFVTFSTNGINSERVEKSVINILNKCPGVSLKVYVSIDNLGEKHDEIRGVKGAFDKAVKTVSLLNALKRNNPSLLVFIETVLSSFNKKDMFKIISFIDESVKPDSHNISLARGNTREGASRAVSLDEYSEVMKFLKKNRDMKKSVHTVLLDIMTEVIFKTLKTDSMVMPCVAGRRMLTLFDEGSVAPCEMLTQFYDDGRFIIGNIRDYNYNIMDLMKSEKAISSLEFIKKTNCHCSFECSNLCNVVFNYKMYPRIARELFI